MKKGFWNYTEEIEYTVILVKLLKQLSPPLHWQNAFEGQERQVVAITCKRTDGSKEQFWIDNEDGSGLRKIEKGGGPDSYSAHLGSFEFIRELPESEWQEYSPLIHKLQREICDNWQRTNYPEDFKRMEALRKMINKHR